jgi:hypothetical protein
MRQTRQINAVLSKLASRIISWIFLIFLLGCLAERTAAIIDKPY